MRRAVCLLTLFLALASLSRAQDDPLPLAERRKAVLEGTHVFRRILADAELSPLDSFDALVKETAKSVLIVLGDLNVLDKIPGGLEKFVRDGGAVLLASDRAVTNRTARQQLIATAGVTINSETLVCRQTQQCYKGLDYCPTVVTWSPPDPHLFRTEAGGVFLATNTPSMLIPKYVRLDPPVLRLPVMATLPLECFVETPQGQRPAIRGLEVDFNGNILRESNRNYPTFMVGGDLGAGRALVLADHSVFINEMMMPTDNQNVEFTYNAVTWLRGDDKGRDRALFVEEGAIETKFDLPVKPGNIPAKEALQILFAKRNELLVKAEEKLAQWEDEGFYDNKVLDWLASKGLSPRGLASWAVVIAAGLLMVLMLARLGFRYRFHQDTTAPPLVSAVSGNFPARPLAEQRGLAMIRQNNAAEAAGGLVRQWFARQGIDVAPSSAAPPFRGAGGWWERRRRARRLRQLWELASGRSATPVAAPEIWTLQRELEALEAARRRGEWGLNSGSDER